MRAARVNIISKGRKAKTMSWKTVQNTAYSWRERKSRLIILCGFVTQYLHLFLLLFFQQKILLLQSLHRRRGALHQWQLIKNYMLWCLVVPPRPEMCGWKCAKKTGAAYSAVHRCELKETCLCDMTVLQTALIKKSVVPEKSLSLSAQTHTERIVSAAIKVCLYINMAIETLIFSYSIYYQRFMQYHFLRIAWKWRWIFMIWCEMFPWIFLMNCLYCLRYNNEK